MKTSFLLISDRDEPAWSALLREALTPLGLLQTISEDKAAAEILHAHYDLIIIDAAAIDQPTQLVTDLRVRRPEMPIAVASVAPTWQETRNVLRAGAVDYFRRSPNKEELLSTIRDILTRLPQVAAH